MKIQQKKIKSFLITITFLIIASFSFAQATTSVIFRVEINIIDKDELFVKIFNPNTFSKDLVFSFLETVPNYYLDVDIIENIKEFNVYYKDKTFRKVDLKDKITIRKDFDYIQYKVVLPEINSKSFLPVSSYIKDGEYAVFNFSTILGYFKNIEQNVDLNLFVKKEQMLYLNTNYASLVKNTFTIGFNEIKFKTSDFPLHTTINSNEIISTYVLKDYAIEALSAIRNIENFDREITKEMIFIFDSASNNTGAINHENSIVFHFNTNDRYIIQKTIIHETLHWILPNQKSWLNESLAEYLALKLMLKHNLICDLDFFEKMTRKLQLAHKYKKTSLDDVYKSSKNYNILYTKGAFYAWILDLIVLKNTNYKYGILKYILNSTEIKKSERDIISSEILKFEEDYIKGYKYFSYNKYLNTIGVLFEQNKLKEIKPKQTLVFEQCNSNLVIIDNAELEELQKNDKIISIDGKKEIEEINKKLHSMSAKTSTFVVLRNGEKIKIKVDNKNSIMRRLQFHISFLETSTAIQKRNWQYYINN